MASTSRPTICIMNDIGHRCMAEQLARSIVAGLLQADAEGEQPLFYP